MATMVRRSRGLAAVVMLALGAALLAGCAAAMLGNASRTGSATARDARTAAQISADRSLAAAVRASLAADPALEGVTVGVEAYRGIVTLRGEVAKSEQRAAAERAARGVSGVRGVRNELRVR